MQVLTQSQFRSWSYLRDSWEGDEGLTGKTPNGLEYYAESDAAAMSDSPVCCWNVCAGFSEKKTPRSSARKSIAVSEACPDHQEGNKGLGLPAAPPTDQSQSEKIQTVAKTTMPRGQHLTSRLLVETLAPDRHLVFNPLSGAVDLATDTDLARLADLRHGKETALTPEQEVLLRTRGYLFDSPDDEEACLEGAVTAAWARMTAAQPQMYTVCPTLACNLACAYCFEGDSLIDKQQGVMTADQVAQVFDAIGHLRRGFAEAEGPDALPPWIALFGGEPLLPSTHGSLAEILRRAAEDGFLVAATTNGVNLTRFEDLLTEYADILTVFQVTLDGPKAVHDARRHRLGGQGTFDEIVRGIDLLLFLGIDVDLRVNLDADNVDDLPELVDFLHERGWVNHPAFALALAPITVHGEGPKESRVEEGGCRSRYDRALTELELARRVMALSEVNPRVAAACHLGFLRHLEYLVGVLEPEKLGIARRGTQRMVGPRYWYCEASTDKQYVFTPEGLIYNCTEAVGRNTQWDATTGRWSCGARSVASGWAGPSSHTRSAGRTRSRRSAAAAATWVPAHTRRLPRPCCRSPCPTAPAGGKSLARQPLRNLSATEQRRRSAPICARLEAAQSVKTGCPARLALSRSTCTFLRSALPRLRGRAGQVFDGS